MRYAFILAIALFLQPITAMAAELVVSSSDLSVQVSGPWQTGTTPGTNQDYLFRTPGAGGATVFWPFPTSLGAGQYQVYANWVSGPDRASNATYYVASSDSTQTVTENQQTNGGSWQSLGTFAFTPGSGQGVTLTDSATGIVVAGSVRYVTVSDVPQAATAPQPTATPAPTAAAPTTAVPSTSPDASWTVALGATDLHAGPDAGTDTLASVPQFSYLQVLGYSGDWAYVYNPRARGTAYVRSNAIGPSDPPPAWVTAPPPAPVASVEMMGRTVGKASLAYFPVDDKFAYTSSLGHNVPILVHDRVQGPDGSTWYRVDGGYLAAGSVRLPRPPDRTFSGRWIDADLQEPAMLTAYEGSRLVMDTLAIKGTIANQTPTGVFTILRRVQDETMDSGTLGIDPHGPGGYHLEHVLNTQYFTNDGASIHYNWWSSNFGYSGSHGCLGVDLEDSQFIWNWADIGTPVVIRNS
ncbi:MAG: L,D-transpeptidase family protein [Chloroflexi bacterium]|nr:L,D-transpeptidase family protein [Chloroflexota bacterium]